MPIDWTPFTRQGRKWSIGSFRVLKLGASVALPEGFRGQSYSKLKSEKEKLICIKFGKNGNCTTESCIGTSSKNNKRIFR